MRKHRFYLFVIAVPALAGIAVQKPTASSASTGSTMAREVTQMGADNLVNTSSATSALSGSPGSDMAMTGFNVALASLHTPVTVIAAPAVVTPAPTPAVVVPPPPPPPAPVPAPAPAVVVPAPAPPPAPVVVTASSGSPAQGVWAELRQCESSGNYAVDTGNGYYGAYQFSLQTWQGLGYSGLPSNAPASTQDQAAQRLESERGWGQWPACSRKLGL